MAREADGTPTAGGEGIFPDEEFQAMQVNLDDLVRMKVSCMSQDVVGILEVDAVDFLMPVCNKL